MMRALNRPRPPNLGAYPGELMKGRAPVNRSRAARVWNKNAHDLEQRKLLWARSLRRLFQVFPMFQVKNSHPATCSTCWLSGAPVPRSSFRIWNTWNIGNKGRNPVGDKRFAALQI